MCVQTVKKDEHGDPDRAKSCIVALGNQEDRVWAKSEKFAPVLRGESSRIMIYGSSIRPLRKQSKAIARTLSVNPTFPKMRQSSCVPRAGAHSANRATYGC
jgi:hypothetical protein